ncbi:hypothetical protein FI667_g6551, partial [Globisporangium splendens]
MAQLRIALRFASTRMFGVIPVHEANAGVARSAPKIPAGIPPNAYNNATIIPTLSARRSSITAYKSAPMTKNTKRNSGRRMILLEILRARALRKRSLAASERSAVGNVVAGWSSKNHVSSSQLGPLAARLDVADAPKRCLTSETKSSASWREALGNVQHVELDVVEVSHAVAEPVASKLSDGADALWSDTHQDDLILGWVVRRWQEGEARDVLANWNARLQGESKELPELRAWASIGAVGNRVGDEACGSSGENGKGLHLDGVGGCCHCEAWKQIRNDSMPFERNLVNL